MQKGQSLVETAMALPYLAFIVLGIVVFGAAYARDQQVEDAAREGARAAQVWQANGTITCYQYVVDHVAAAVSYEMTVTVSDNCSATNAWLRIGSDEYVTVTAVNIYQPIFIGTLFKGQWQPPDTIPLTASVTTKHE
jgi:Flp pilus assembly protein TadG